MEKLFAIPDLHGNPVWKEILKEKKFRKVVFLGDYFDSRNFNIGIEDELQNFKEILEFRNQHPEKIELLCGNHDLHYLNDVSAICSGFQPEYFEKINAILQPVFDDKILKVCYFDKKDQIMFSHAGISKSWLEKTFNRVNYSFVEMSEIINQLFWKFPMAFEFQSLEDDEDGNGDSVLETPLWIRPYSLRKNPLDCKQVVGHTQQKKIRRLGNITFIDTLNSGEGFFEV